MCGRARCTLHAGQIAAACGFAEDNGGGGDGDDCPLPTRHMDRFRPSFNVSPGYYVPVVAIQKDGSGEEGLPVVQCMKWGLVPSFTKKNDKPDHFRMFNARSESIKEKASFRRLIPHSRCLVVFEGFYEWKKNGSQKQPYYIHFKDHRPLILAALYDSWENHEGEVLYTLTILTTCSSSSLRWLHDRMPVILGNKGSADKWLEKSASHFEELLRPYEDSDLVWYPVTTAMGKTTFDGPECIREIHLKSSPHNQISNFFKKIDPEVDSRSDSPVSYLESSQEYLSDGAKSQPELATKPSDRVHTSSDSSSAIKKETIGSSALDQELGDDSLFVADSKDLIPAMKTRSKNVGDKQPTLLSYFRKN